jgi:hypothetical protein
MVSSEDGVTAVVSSAPPGPILTTISDADVEYTGGPP